MVTFEITREDGRSNQQVLIDHVKDGEPGTLYTYRQLGELLGFDDRSRIQGVVNLSQHRLLKECNKTMTNVRGRGYRLAGASEHVGIACVRRRKADTQLRKGLHVLRHVDWDALDDESRKAHQGTLMVMSAVYSAQASMERRQASIEESLERLKSRVDQLGS
jgi:hypothetical protein